MRSYSYFPQYVVVIWKMIINSTHIATYVVAKVFKVLIIMRYSPSFIQFLRANNIIQGNNGLEYN